MKFFTSSFQIPIFKNFIEDIVITVSTILETLYYPDQAMEKQIDNNDDETYKVYVKLIDKEFPGIVWKLIEIINNALEKLII